MEVVVTANQSEYLSKADLLFWINDTLSLNVSKIEVLGTGSIYCQLLDLLYPNKIPLQKVNWKAKFEYEFVHNYKILQQSFTKLDIKKPVEVEKLIKCKHQDNLEFLQWFKKFFDNHSFNKEYNAVQRRNEAEVDFSFIDKNSKKEKQSIGGGKNSLNKIPHPKQYQAMSKNSSFSNLSMMKEEGNVGGSPLKNTSYLKQQSSNSQQRSTNNNNNNINTEQSLQFECLKTERDFFFNKLKDIDHLMEVSEEQDAESLKSKIREILYMLPDKVCLVLDDGQVQISTKSQQSQQQQQQFSSAQQITSYQDLVLQNDENKMIIEENIIKNENLYNNNQQQQFSQNSLLQMQGNFTKNLIGEKIMENNINNSNANKNSQNSNNNMGMMSGNASPIKAVHNHQDSALKEIQNNLQQLENQQQQHQNYNNNNSNNNNNIMMCNQQQQQQQNSNNDQIEQETNNNNNNDNVDANEDQFTNKNNYNNEAINDENNNNNAMGTNFNQNITNREKNTSDFTRLQPDVTNVLNEQINKNEHTTEHENLLSGEDDDDDLLA